MSTRPKDRISPEARALASEIVETMFRNGRGNEADRLVLVDSSDRDLGGWGRRPFADRIEPLIQRALDGRGIGTS